MRKLEVVRGTPDGDCTLSLVPWGLIRRLIHWRDAKNVFGFVPRYELEILHGLDVLHPHCVFHFADNATTREMYHKIAQALMQGGLHGASLIRVLRDADRKKVDAHWAPDWLPMA
jgi:hypothetical protein